MTEPSLQPISGFAILQRDSERAHGGHESTCPMYEVCVQRSPSDKVLVQIEVSDGIDKAKENDLRNWRTIDFLTLSSSSCAVATSSSITALGGGGDNNQSRNIRV